MIDPKHKHLEDLIALELIDPLIDRHAEFIKHLRLKWIAG